MTFRKTATWMEKLDDRILECLHEHGPATPEVLAHVYSFEATRREVAERCRVLTGAGLIAPQRRGSRVYEITVWGRLYLDGEIDAQHQHPFRTQWPAVRSTV